MDRPKIGIALSAGAARGFAHLGVLRVLQAANIPIDYIAGSSMGSFIGALYANGLDLDMVEQIAIHLDRNCWVDMMFPGLGFISGKKVHELTRLLTHNKNLEDLAIPLAVVTTDLLSGDKVVFQTGSIADAVRASISVPGVFEPVPYKDKLLVDGGVADRLPISVVRDMGADFVIAVDVLSQAKEVQVKSAIDVIAQAITIMERQILTTQMLTADFMILPEVGDISPTAFQRAQECIYCGEEAIQPKLAQLKEKIANWQGENRDVSHIKSP